MKSMMSGAAVSAIVATFGITAAAQAPTQPPSPTQVQRPAPASGSTAASTDQQVTVTGCIVREADFRKTQDAGRGGVAGTGVGVGNEFILSSAAMAPGSATQGLASGVAAFELTGPNEGQATAHLGKRVEIVGKIKAGEVSAAGPTGGPTAGAPPRGVDVASKDLKLSELEIASIKASTGTCPS